MLQTAILYLWMPTVGKRNGYAYALTHGLVKVLRFQIGGVSGIITNYCRLQSEH